MVATASSRPAQFSFNTEMVPGLSPEEADRRYREADRATEVGRRVCAYYAHQIKSRKLYKFLGFSTFADYAASRGHTDGTMRRYAHVGEMLQGLKVIDGFFNEQKLCWSVVRELTKVATPKTDREWAEWAVGKTAREVAERVQEHRAAEADPDGRRIHHPRIKFSAQLITEDYRKVQAVRAALESKDGRPRTDDEVLLALR